MSIIALKLLLAKFLKDNIKEKAGSEFTDAAFKPVTGLVESGQEKLLEMLGHIDPELADILNKAIAESYVAAVQEITDRYLNSQKNKILLAESDIKRDEEIRNNLRVLAAKPIYHIAPKMESTAVLQRLIRGTKILQVLFAKQLLRTDSQRTSPVLEHRLLIIF